MAIESQRVQVTVQGENLGVFDLGRMTLFDALQVKAKSGLTVRQFAQGLEDYDPLSVQALVWLMRQRNGQHVELHAINFGIGDIDLEAVPDPTQETSGNGDAATSVSSPTSAT